MTGADVSHNAVGPCHLPPERDAIHMCIRQNALPEPEELPTFDWSRGMLGRLEENLARATTIKT